MMAQNLSKIRLLTPLHLPQTPSPATYPLTLLALTLFITLKGWGTGVPHLAGLTSTLAHILLHRHTYIGKGWGTGVPHLVDPNK